MNINDFDCVAWNPSVRSEGDSEPHPPDSPEEPEILHADGSPRKVLKIADSAIDTSASLFAKACQEIVQWRNGKKFIHNCACWPVLLTKEIGNWLSVVGLSWQDTASFVSKVCRDLRTSAIVIPTALECVKEGWMSVAGLPEPDHEPYYWGVIRQHFITRCDNSKHRNALTSNLIAMRKILTNALLRVERTQVALPNDLSVVEIVEDILPPHRATITLAYAGASFPIEIRRRQDRKSWTKVSDAAWDQHKITLPKIAPSVWTSLIKVHPRDGQSRTTKAIEEAVAELMFRGRTQGKREWWVIVKDVVQRVATAGLRISDEEVREVIGAQARGWTSQLVYLKAGPDLKGIPARVYVRPDSPTPSDPAIDHSEVCVSIPIRPAKDPDADHDEDLDSMKPPTESDTETVEAPSEEDPF